MLSDAVVAWIRTVVPVAIGSGIAWLAGVGIVLPDDASGGAVVAITATTIAVYYTAAAWLSRKFSWLGILLGNPKQPTYRAP